MMPLLVSMLRRRPFQGLTMLLLAAAATVAALAGPAYLRSIDAHVASSQFDSSTLEQRRLTLVGRVDADPDSAAVDPRTLITTLLPVANFTSLTSVSFPVIMPVTNPRQTAFTGTVLDRQDECEHIRVIAGRCVAGVAEVMLPDTTATRLHLAPGDTVPLGYSTYDNRLLAQEPAGSVVTNTVVGVYQPIDPSDIYWGAKDFFAAGLQPPILTDDATVAAMSPTVAEFDVDAIAAKAAFTGNLDRLSSQVTAVTSVVNKLSAKMDVSTQIPDLVASIRSNQRAASEVIPVASAPLLVFAWCVIFIAASYAAASRRGEFAVIGLRGAPLRLRWLLAVGESITAILVGTAAGYAIMSLWTPVNVIWPLIALIGSIVAALLAQFRLIVGSVSAMLRHGKPGSGRLGWIAQAVGVLIVLVTAAAVVRIRESGGDLRGVTALAPGLVVLGTSVLASLAVVPVARVLGRSALRRGRVATALAAYYVGRRPGAQRLLVLIAVAVGLLAFATAGLGVASRDRAAVARVQTGAPTVLTVDTLTRAELLEGVRAADPSGAWAMAVAARPANDSTSGDGTPPTIAVDATRLGAVATWLPAYGPMSAARIGALLHPTGLPAPTIFIGSRFEMTATVSGLDPTANIFLDITLLPLDGSKPLTISDQIRNGPVTIGGPATCQMGCRLRGISLDRINSVPFRFVMTLGALSVDGKPLPHLDTASAWSTSPGGAVAGSATGVAATFISSRDSATAYWLRPRNAPTPLPVVSTAQLDQTELPGLDNADLPVVEVATVTGMPRLGRDGVLMDLDYADLLSSDSGAPTDPQVWLGPHAPRNAIALLAAHGVVVTSSETIDSTRSRFSDQGAALALWFHLFAAVLAGVLALGTLMLVGGVDRSPRAAELAALRVQGVTSRTIGRAASSGYVVLVAAAACVGLIAGGLAWWASGAYMPIFTNRPLWMAGTWPGVPAIGVPWLVAVVVLVAVAVAIGSGLRRSIRRRGAMP